MNNIPQVLFFFRCLEKNPENRPAMAEIIQHPFIEEVPGNDFTVITYSLMIEIDHQEHVNIRLSDVLSFPFFDCFAAFS